MDEPKRPMRVADVPICPPILGTSLSRDGRFLAATVRRYDAARSEQRARLFVLDLAGEAASWTEPDAPEASFASPVIAPDGRRLAALRLLDGVGALVVYDLVDGGPPTVAASPPPAPAVVKWWGAPGLLACLGDDEEGTRRVYCWDDLGAAPRPVTPARQRVVDYAFVGDTDTLVWIYGPPTPIGGRARAEVPQLRVGRLGETTWRTLVLPGGPDGDELPLGYLAVSPDGARVALLTRPAGQPLSEPRLWVVPLAGGPAVRLLDTPGWITGYDWTPDGSALVVAHEVGVDGRLSRVPVDGGAVAPVGAVDRCLSGPHLDRVTGRLVHLDQDVDSPQKLVLRDPGAPPRTVSNFHHRLDRLARCPAERFTWTGEDGLPLEGLLVRPAGEPPWPLIVWLHGGPAEHLQRTFSPYFQAMAGAGYAVFAPNMRGSTGRGDAFMRSLVGRIGEDDVRDVERGVRRLITTGIVHRRRVGLMGWSYGASLALHLAASGRWVRAVVAGAPVADWLTVFGARRWPTLTPEWFGGAPWEVPEAYDRASPIRRIGSLEAPTLLLHGELDDRVPPSQSRLVWHLLRARGIPSDVRLFPGEGHVFAAPWAVQEMLVRALAWFGEHTAL